MISRGDEVDSYLRCLQDLLEDRESNPTSASGISTADANERDGSDSSEDPSDDDPANNWRLEKRYENLESIGFSLKLLAFLVSFCKW